MTKFKIGISLSATNNLCYVYLRNELTVYQSYTSIITLVGTVYAF